MHSKPRFLRNVFGVFALVTASLTSIGRVSAATESILWSFTYGANDGLTPFAGVVMDPDGNLYGTTFYGGANNQGAVFKLTPQGTESVLWSFGNGNDGANSSARLILDASGNLYGTTAYGGIYGNGTVFKITPEGNESILWNFGNGADGQQPFDGLIMDHSGNLYGTTYQGGSNGLGTVFKLSVLGKETILWNFQLHPDASTPDGRLLLDANGNLYGTTQYGGTYGAGTAFKLSDNRDETVLWSFGKPGDGATPGGGLIMDTAGNLYGTTSLGGRVPQGGTIFKLAPDGSESILLDFAIGNAPSGPLLMDQNGNLYGEAGGGPYLGGTVFSLTPAGTESILWDFGNPSNPGDGVGPTGGLILDKSGDLFGTTGGGGVGGFNSGTVFGLSQLGPRVVASPKDIVFQNTPLGSISTAIIKLVNTGNTQLSGSVSAPAAPFGLSGSGGFALEPKAQTTITLTFTPTSTAQVTQSVSVPSNAKNQGIVQLELEGTGTP